MNSKIDITMVATIRPDILRRTLDSWCKNMFINQDRYRLIFHLDNIGEKKDPSIMIDIIKEYFNDIKYEISLYEFSQSKAFKWCWDQVTSDFVMLVDDDWELLKRVDIDELITIHNKIKKLANLILPNGPVPVAKGKIKYGKTICECVPIPICIADTCKYAYYKGVLIATGNKFNIFNIHPQLLKGAFVKQVRQFLDINKDPELQLKFRGENKRVEDIANKWDIGIYAKPGDSIYIKDIGREWMNEIGFKKCEKVDTPNAMKWNI